MSQQKTYLSLRTLWGILAIGLLLALAAGGRVAADASSPTAVTAAALSVTPTSGGAGAVVQLDGAGYTPGGYAGTIRWDGADVDTFMIPNGGAFSIPFTIPSGAAAGAHTITVCALSPCATGEFEQLASAPFEVTEYQLFLPAIMNDSGTPAPEPFSYDVDAAVQPSQSELPGLDGKTARPLAAVKSPRGDVTTFVANEMVVQTDDAAALAALLARTSGEIILEVDPMDAGIKTLPKMYLVRVDLDTADLSNLVADITALMEGEIESAGEFIFSGEDGARAFALAAAEAQDGLTVGINWVGETTSVPDDSVEAPGGPIVGGLPYDSDAYNWPHFAQGTVQDIGVPEAWTLLHRGGRLSNRVRLAILDGGFFPNNDFPAGTTYLSVFPFDPRNVNGVDGSAPYHGTDVLQTAVADSDDGFGIVGVAAPVADPIALYTSYDYMVSIASVLMARAAGAKVMNMSYSASVPAIFAWTVWPFEATTVAVRASGALLFASAGNDGRDVDGENCFIVCWEHTWITPCENAGVICVGGLGWNSKNRAGGSTLRTGSNFGAENVDIFAPYTVYRGQSPAAPAGGTTVGTINGTSFASPYAASVAALIWAADPSLSATQVWQTMRDTAHTSPDRRVNLYVNAYDAVLSAIGVGVAVDMQSPINGATYELNSNVHMYAEVGYVAEAGGTPVTVQWRSQPEGRILRTDTYSPGAGSHAIYSDFHVNDLSEGAHTISVRVTAGTVVAEDSVAITIHNTPPTAVIAQPTAGAAFCPGELVTFRGTSFDPNELGGLPDSAFAWRSNINGALGTGATYSTSSLSSGSHTVTLRVTDSGGLYAEDTVAITILAPTHPDCVDLGPSALISTPAHNTSFFIEASDSFGWYATVTFTGYVSDPEDPISALNVEWLSDEQGDLGTPSVNSVTGYTSITARMYIVPGDVYETWHTITLRVTDSAGNVKEDQINIRVYTLF